MIRCIILILGIIPSILLSQTQDKIEQYRKEQEKKMQAIQNEASKFERDEQEKKRKFIEQRNAEMQAFIKSEEDWNLLTLGYKGNVRETVIEKREIKKEENSEQQPFEEQKKFEERTSKPSYIKVIPEEKKSGYISPLPKGSYRTSSKFGYRIHPIYKSKRFHGGVDFAAPKGTKVFSTNSGIVEHSGWSDSYGNFIIVKHEDGRKSIYAHLDKLNVSKGTKVEKGAIIGFVGMTGSATGNHLHFEIVDSGKKIDPVSLIEV